MKWITLLFFIGFIGRVVRGNNNNNDDPAPGRSPGPPSLYSLEASHESYRPSENSDSSQNLDSSDGNSYGDLFSSISHETEQVQSEYSDDSEIKFSEKFRAINNPNDSSTFKNSSLSSLPSHATTNNLEKFDRQSTKNGSVTQSSVNSDDDDDKTHKNKNRCTSGVPTRTRISDYLRLGDRIVQINSNYIKDSDDESVRKNKERKFRIDVTHDVFDTASIVAGIIYKVEVLQPFPRDVIDFMLETTTTRENEAIGSFLLETPVDRNKSETPGDNEGLFKQLVMTSTMTSDSVETNRRDSNSISDQNDCERNLVYHKFNLEDDKVIFNWTTGNMALTAESNFINFRIYYRHRSRREVFETNFTLILLQECTLKLKAYSGWLDSILLPYHYQKCTFNFPLLTKNRYMQQHPPGLLIKLLRLNVPCTSGGFLRFNESTTLCGKFEELSDAQRTLYFSSFSSTSVTTFNYPKFHFIYKLVDYCYNITLLDQNSSFVIEPTHSLALKCHFKIHLPFGNGIALKLRHQLDANVPTIMKEIQLSRQSLPDKEPRNANNLENFSPNADSSAFLDSEDIDCDGISVQLMNRMNEKWSECLGNSMETNVEFMLTLPDNVLLIMIRIAKHIPKSTTANIDELINTSSLVNLEYTAVPNETIVSQCAFGWILVDQYCIAAFDELLTWQQAENRCNELDGHLAAISNDLHQYFADQMLLNSPHYHEYVSYWIGATDKFTEGDFHWTDGRTFSYSKWFPGWDEHGNYNRQPNDDGLSEQDCVEIRRYYQRPMTNGVIPSSSSLTESFMWNDRDCATKNFFLCERPLIDEPVKNVEFEDCNKTIHLSRDNMKVSLTTPGFPRFYPDNVNCFSFIIAPNGYRILIEFEELILEQEPQCAYDFVEVFEPTLVQNVNVTSRRARHVSQEGVQHFNEFQQLLHDYEYKKLQARNIFQPSNATYNIFIPPPSTLNERMPRKICGDWSSKLKLLRHKSSSNSLGIRFTSDYSHHFSGFKAKIALEKAASECVDERLKLFNESCYLVVSFPLVERVVAQKICHSMGAQLSSVSSLDEHRFIITTIRNNLEYNPRLFYWLGAEYAKSGEFEWTDGSRMSFIGGWHQESDKLIPKAQQTEPICMALQWKISNNPRLPSNLYWSSQKCSQLGGYVCKQSKKSNILIQNMTITETEGQLRSPDYPNTYASNINYWVKIIAPKKSRIVMQFQMLDIEYQEQCLYDYVSIQDSEFHHVQSNNERRSSFSKIDVVNIDYDAVDRRRHIRALDEGSNDSFPSFQSYVRWCGKHSGDMTRFDFISRSNEILINFFTDNSMAGEGFSAMWRSIDISACPEQTLTSREGNLSSPNFPHFLLHNLNCSYNIQAPIGRKIWLEFLAFDIAFDANIQVDLGDGALLQPFSSKNIISDGVYASKGEHVKIHLQTGSHPRGRGFNVIFRTMPKIVEHRVVHLSNSTLGRVYHLNYPHTIPQNIDYSQHLIARLGDVISIELHGLRFVNNESGECNDSNVIEIFDKYADRNGTFWQLCGFTDRKQISSAAPIFITSYLNTIHIRQHSINSNELGLLNATIRVHSDINYKMKLITTTDDWVEDCNPNPCQNGGKCVTMGTKQVCQCIGHFTGRFCRLTMCELDPCVFGKCELTSNHFKCHCQVGYLGITCDQRQKPCNDNPCENRGQCVPKNGGYECRCFAWFEGPKCERRMKIPYRPLSERMFQEPFWLGLITVFVVLSVIGLVWCAKRHFPEKIEKLLQEEADRSRSAHLRHHHHISLREQLQVAGAANNPIMQGMNSVGNATTPGSDSRKSIFNRLGIRKPSILSLSSPQFPSSSTARTFSLDDLLRPTPRHTHQNSHVGTPSPRKKRNNSTPVQRKNNNVEKKQILQQLVSPNSNKVTLGELIQLSESSNHTNSLSRDSDDIRETAFMESSSSTIVGTSMLSRQLPSDPKFEKKVTFARLLSKMSAEITNGSDIDGNHYSALSLPTEVQFRANSVPQSPCTNDHIRLTSPHSTSSNQGSDSLSSSELALHEFSFRNNRKHRPKVSSADSILAMFRNFASSSAGVNLPPSLIFSPSSTPTASSPQDEIVGDDESSTSSIPTPVSFSSNAPDSPVFYRQSTIEVPVLDAINAHKSSPVQSLLHPPTILLEIPGNINKCLSPIHEMPTPMPSPALTPVMPRPHRIGKSPQVYDETISVSLSDDDDKNQPPLKHHILVDLSAEMNRNDSDNEDTINTTSSENSHITVRQVRRLVSTPAIDISPPTPVESERKSISERPKDLIIPDLVVQSPSPTKERLPLLVFPGSPPPQRASIGETSGLFPNKQQQKRLMMQYEKPGSLDFQFAPPMIKISMSEVESDAEFLSPATSKANLMPCNKTSTSGMSYLSPFSMCARGRAPSEGNLSSSGYSSMASPGHSRCNSNNPLCSSEVDISIIVPKRHPSILKKTDDKDNGNEQQFRKRSDSETLSDETLLESNDEGIGTDHLDEKIEDGEIKSARDMEIFIGKELLDSGRNLLGNEDLIAPMSQLQLPSIVIQCESGVEKLSPVSSRSESPLSDRNNGMGRFSPQFYNKRDQQLPFTDSDGLYDFPSSDGKSGNSAGAHNVKKSSTGRRRERRNSKSCKDQLQSSPSKSSVHLELPSKSSINVNNVATSSKFSGSANFNRKSPKRRPARYTPSSSSSTESLTASSNTKDTSMPSIKLRDCLIESIESSQYGCGNVPDESDKYGSGMSSASSRKNETVSGKKSPQPKKIGRLKAIGNQIRFLRRLEQALKERDKMQSSDSCNDNESDILDSPKASSPLLSTNSKTSKFSRQMRVSNVYSFDPEREEALADRDLMSD